MGAVGLGTRRARDLPNGTVERLIAEGKLAPGTKTIFGAAAPAEPQPSKSWYDRLVERFGLGEDPKKREALYRRIQRLCLAKGKEVELWVYEAAEKAGGAEQPDRYFCAAITRMLRLVEVHTL